MSELKACQEAYEDQAKIILTRVIQACDKTGCAGCPENIAEMVMVLRELNRPDTRLSEALALIAVKDEALKKAHGMLSVLADSHGAICEDCNCWLIAALAAKMKSEGI